jgi:acid stress chaperone HdeB
MKPAFVITAVCLLTTSVLAPLPVAAKKAQTQDINFGAITCGEFMQELSTSSAEDAGVVFMWIDGYLSGVSGDTKLSWKNLEKFSTDLVTYCAKQPATKVLDAAEAVGVSN